PRVEAAAPAPATRSIASALTDSRASAAAYVEDAALDFLQPLHGESGKLKAVFRTPGEAVGKPQDPHLSAVYTGQEDYASSEFKAPEHPGLYKLAVALGEVHREVNDLGVITMVPFSAKENGKVGPYYLGSWPYESGGKPPKPAYANPLGF